MAGSKNLGQVAGIYVGTTPPENIKMIWWDSTSSQQCHKIYDYNLKQWIILNQGILSTITYTELRNIALTVGLSLGKFYVVTDKGNVLALSITKTKVQYVDISGNLLVDDLGSNIQYYVSSNNLTIDGETGVFNQESTKLNFNFTEATPVFDTAYIYGKDRTSSSSSVMRLIKFKLSSLISTVTGNALSWNSGLYFNFNQTLLDLGDKKGGVVLFDTYTKEQEVQDQSIENIANNYNALVSQVNALVTSATSDANIMNKKITALQTGGEPIDAAAGDTLYTVLSKFQRYINKFKYATGISISKNFKEATDPEYINNNDTVESAFSKVQYWLKNIYSTLSLSKDFKPATDPSYGTPIPECAPLDPIETAIAKLQGVLNDIGTITDGNIKSKQQAVNSSGQNRGNRMEISLSQGSIGIKADQYGGGSSGGDVTLNTSGLNVYDSINIKSANLTTSGLYANGGGQTSGYPYNGHSTANLFISGNWGDSTIPNILDDWYAGLYAWANNSYSGEYPKWAYGAYIERLCAAGLVLRTVTLRDSDSGTTLGNLVSYYSCYNSNANITLNLPAKPQKGQCLWIRQVNPNGIVLNGNGKEIVRNENSTGGSSSVTVSDRGALYFLCFDGIYWMMNKQNQ